jgi:hypothetical protein
MKTPERLSTLNNLSAWNANARRRYLEDKPRVYWVMIELFIIGVITGYWVPVWCSMIVNPHERTRIDTLLGNQFSGGMENIVTSDVLIASYSVQE